MTPANIIQSTINDYGPVSTKHADGEPNTTILWLQHLRNLSDHVEPHELINIIQRIIAGDVVPDNDVLESIIDKLSGTSWMTLVNATRNLGVLDDDEQLVLDIIDQLYRYGEYNAVLVALRLNNKANTFDPFVKFIEDNHPL